MRIQNINLNSQKIKDKENQINDLLSEILNRNIIDAETHKFIEDFVNESKTIENQENLYFKELNAFEKKLLKEIERKYKLVKKDYYKNLWTVLGMATFGPLISGLFGSIFKNMAFLGIGFPVGLLIGRQLGSYMDKKAAEENRQLNIK